MRKLTYTQAATCGKNLKVRVTPEQSEKMQQAWFAAGKAWAYGGTEVVFYLNDPFMYLYSDNTLCVGDYENEFSDSKAEEIELIDDLPQSDFASQQEIWRYLSENECNMIQDIAGIKVWSFKFGSIHNINFSDFKNWKKYTKPRLIRVNGIEVPAPLESLDGVEQPWIVDVNDKEKAIVFSLLDDAEDRNLWLNLGLCYATKEDAIKRAEAMLKFEVVK